MTYTNIEKRIISGHALHSILFSYMKREGYPRTESTTNEARQDLPKD